MNNLPFCCTIWKRFVEESWRKVVVFQGEPFKIGVLGVITGSQASWGLVCKYSTKAFVKMSNGGDILNPTKKVGGRQANFTKTFENKEFKRKLTNCF